MKLARLFLLALTSLPLAACGAVAVAPNARDVQFATVEEVFEGSGDALALSGELPLVFLVGDAASVDDLLAAREDLVGEFGTEALVTVINLESLDSLQRTSMADRALEAALDVEGPVLLDDTGATARSLTGGSPGLRLVRVDEGLLVTDELELPVADTAALAALFAKP